MTVPEHRRGRPRSREADRAIASATLALLEQGGFAALRMEQVADRAGVGKATLYRRWQTKDELVAAALATFVDDFALPDSGDTRDDVAVVLRYQLGLLATAIGRTVTTLLTEASFRPHLAEALREPIRQSREPLRLVLQRGLDRGELRAGLDVERAIDLLWGPIYYRSLVSLVEGEEARPDYVESVVDEVWRTLQA